MDNDAVKTDMDSGVAMGTMDTLSVTFFHPSIKLTHHGVGFPMLGAPLTAK